MIRLIPMLLVTLVAVCSAGVVWAVDPVWIDVRTAEEFSSGHVAEASNIPHDQISQKIDTVTTDKDQLIYVYCRSGRRSGFAKSALEELGYTQVVNIGGLEQALQKSEMMSED